MANKVDEIIYKFRVNWLEVYKVFVYCLHLTHFAFEHLKVNFCLFLPTLLTPIFLLKS